MWHDRGVPEGGAFPKAARLIFDLEPQGAATLIGGPRLWSAMSEGWFTKPVPVAVGVIGDARNIMSARQAADLLAEHWPTKGSPKHRDALVACQDAQHGLKSADAARAIFVEAALEARVLIE